VSVILANPALLKTIFSLKRNFSQGYSPSRKVISGIEVAPFKNNAQAAVCISSDFEMSWAFRGRGRHAAEHIGITERQNVPRILQLLEKYSVPITWATVGHLFLESCERGESGFPHAHMPRPVVNDRWEGDWYKHDPCTDFRKDPSWYAPDLIQQVIACKTPQELGTHSFSHVSFADHCSTPELVQREMEECVRVMKPFGVKPRAFVFPHNISEYSYLPLLADAGITAVRHRDKKIRLSYPERTPSGVYKIYESMNLRAARHYDYVDKARIFIEKAMERHAAYALWFHPSDPIDVFENQFQGILKYVDSERKSGRLWVAPMSELVAYCEAREHLDLNLHRSENAITVSVRSTLDTSRYGPSEVSLLIPVNSTPKSGSLELAGGQTQPLTWQPAAGDSQCVLVTIPTDAKTLHFTF
jgi:peptidoglycan/xylan/chitin deacetylase (PgdA/CDA1 family)